VAVLRIRQLLDQGGEADLAGCLHAQGVVQGFAAQTLARQFVRSGHRRPRGPRPAVIADLDAEGTPVLPELAVPKVLDA
jgi:hypothetical protein